MEVSIHWCTIFMVDVMENPMIKWMRTGGIPHGFGYPQMVIRLRTVAVASLRPAAELRALHHGALRAVTVAWCVRQTP